jgi:CDP-4-dehydro-6-deoxyglucose reductase
MQVTHIQSGDTFIVDADTDLLSAGLAANIKIPHSCRSGVCGACRAEVISGQFTERQNNELLNANNTPVLLCQTRACSDLEVSFNTGAALPTRTFIIDAIDWRTPFIAVVHLRTRDGEPFDYQSGQYLAVRWSGQRRKLFSMATPAADGRLELHIRRNSDGEFGNWLFDAARPGYLLGVEGPFGEFQWQSRERQKVLMVATGTGFAPIKALLSEQLAQQPGTSIELFWGARQSADVYDLATLRQWADAYPDFRFRVVLSDELVQGEGFLHGNLFDHLPALDDLDIYACGAPAVVTRLRQEQRSGRFFADPFDTAPGSPASAPELVSASIRLGAGSCAQVDLEPGRPLLQELNRLGLPIQQVCGGRLACGSCRVELRGPQPLPAAEIEEQYLLECLPDSTPDSRLACQLVIDSRLEHSTIEL